MKDTVRIGFIGLGGRGQGQLGELLNCEGVVVPAVCDKYEDRAQRGRDIVKEKAGNTPDVYLDYKNLLARADLDAIMCCTTWITHGRIAIDSMRAGKHVAIEVGGAASIEECWQMVRASEETGQMCMLLENCCYDRVEMAVYNMVRQGIFGEIVHLEGGYRHDLRKEVCSGKENRHYRLANYTGRTGDLYPTHELGPIAKYLDINRGNRMVSLCSMASRSAGLNEWAKEHRGPDDEVSRRHFNLGDVVTTIIKCANGQTITLTHDTSLPRPYSRGNLLQGTRGIWSEDKDGVFIEGVSKSSGEWTEHWQPMDEIYERFEHPLWRAFRQDGVKGGHGGMDWLVLRAFLEAVKNGTQTPIDVYDTASWMAITPLSEDSCQMGGLPVAIPDFTDGKWIDPRPIVRSRYCLEAVCEEFF